MKLDESFARSGLVEGELSHALAQRDTEERAGADGSAVLDILENSHVPKEGVEQHIQKNRYSGEGIESCPVFKELGEVGMRAVIQNVEQHSTSAEQFKGMSVAEILAKAKKDRLPSKNETVLKTPVNSDKVIHDIEVSVPESSDLQQRIVLRELPASFASINEEIVLLQYDSPVLPSKEDIKVEMPHEIDQSPAKALSPDIVPASKIGDSFIEPTHIPEPRQPTESMQTVTVVDTLTVDVSRDITANGSEPGVLDGSVLTVNSTHAETDSINIQPDLAELPLEIEKAVDTSITLDEGTAFKVEDSALNLDITPEGGLDSVDPEPLDQSSEAALQIISSVAENLVSYSDIKSETVIQELSRVYEDIRDRVEVSADRVELAIERLCEVLSISPDDAEGYSRIRYILEAYVADLTANSDQSQSLHILNTIGTTEYKFHAGWRGVVVGRGDYNRVSRFILTSLLPQFA